MKKLLYVLSVLVVASMVLAACGPAPTPETIVVTQEVVVTKEVQVEVPAEAQDRTEIRWFVGLGTGTEAAQQTIQREVVDEFNASQDSIYLVMEVVPYNSARDALSTEIASGNAPDLVGPVGWGGSNDFYGQWLDLSSLLADSDFDTSVFNSALVDMYQTEEGQVGLPFMVFPAAVYYRPEFFDEAGLNYPPANYGDKYVMPDGSEVDWSWETLDEVAKMLTIDVNGNNATEAGFDANQIAQYGYEPQWQNGRHMTGFTGGQEFIVDGKSVLNDNAKFAWKNYFDGMWGDQPFIPTGPARGSNELGGGNVFNSGKVAMSITHAWYTCCVGDLVSAGGEFQFGALPSTNGTVYGRVDADTYRIMKSTEHPKEAFEALLYLISEADVKLSTTYGGMPAITAHQDAWLDAKKEQFPFVTSWDTLIAGLGYADTPSAEGYLPNGIEANNRIGTFINLISTDNTVDLDAEIQKLQDDLQIIYDKK